MSKDCFQEGMERKKILDKQLTEFDMAIKKPYRVKIQDSVEIIKKAIEEFNDKIVIACSWGKDSIVVVHLARKINPEIKVIFSNTGVEFPETYRYRDKIVKEWNLNYVELKPQRTFWEIVKEYGYPNPRYLNGVPECCKILKERPAKKYYKEKGIKAVLLGITCDESYNRKWSIIQYGVRHNKEGYIRIYPIAYWNTEEVWKYIQENNIPVNEAYKKYGIERVGCMPCTGHKGWEEQIAKINFNMYKKIAKDIGKPPLEVFE